ncbi:hypothetical protein N665_2849s0003 [Sinapis alba]|nr:hypothetical protein N665_2849s0003 [Sinapis alba]
MAHLFRELSLGHSKRETTPATSRSSSMASTMPSDLPPSPLGQLAVHLSESDLRLIAYDIFVASNRSATGKPLSSVAVSNPDSPSNDVSPASPALQRSLTSAAASKMKKALGMKSLSPGSSKSPGSGSGSGGKSKRPTTVGELMRIQMGVSEPVDSRVRRAFLRIAASQVGRKIESVVLPLELLQQLKSSDFTDQQEYDAWLKRSLKVLEAGLLLHPRVPLGNTNSSQRLRQIIHGALDRPLETGRNNEQMQSLRSAVMSLATRSDGSFSDSCHWADGSPLNLRLYELLLEEVDDLMEHIKKTWVILGINQMLHNLCFTWLLFSRYVVTGQVEMDLLYACESQLAEVAKDAKTAKDPEYSQVLSATLSAILGWAEKRLLAYHDTFDRSNVGNMEGIVSLGVSAARILVEDISNEYRRRRKGEVDVARTRIETYIRSSLRTAFAQRMEKADSSRRASRNQKNPLPVLAILAKDIGELALQEKRMFSPIWKRWHPFAAGVAVATLHVCYGNEIKQFISGISELTPDAVQILRAADKLEKDLVQIAVEDSVDSDDGGKAIIREMPPFEAQTVIANLVKDWIKARIDRLKEWVDRNLQREVWNPLENQEGGYAQSAAEVLRITDETLEAFFQLPITMHPAVLPDLIIGLDKYLQHYVSKAKSGCGSKFQGVWKKKEKAAAPSQKRNSQQVTIANGESSFGATQICVRINSLHKIRSELDVVEKRVVTHLRNCESAHTDDFSNGLGKKFEVTPAACIEATHYGTGYTSVTYPPLESNLSFKELEQNLTVIAETVHERVRTRIITDIMRASFDGFLLVLLAGGPSRAFTIQDSQVMEEDFKSMKDLFWANGDGLAMDLIDKFSTTVTGVLPLFSTDTDSLIDRFKGMTLEAYGSSAKSRLPLPPTSGQWNGMDPNTVLRVLSYRNDESATRFLKKTYNLPKKL